MTQATNFLSGDTVKAQMMRRRERTKNRDAKRDTVMRMVFAKPGFAMVVAKKLGVTHQNVSQWNKVPAHHVLKLVRLLGMTPEQIRPDVFKRRSK